MPYAYCRNCDAGLDSPTFAECIEMKIECHSCHSDYELGHDEHNQALIELEARLCVIEEQFGIKP